VSVYGSLPLSSDFISVAEVVIDGGSPFITPYISADLPFNSNNMSSNYRLYHNTTLSQSTHSIVITAAAGNALWLDYITAGTGVDTSEDISDGIPMSSPQNSSAPGSRPSATSSTGNKGASSSSKSQSRKAGVVGGVVGAVCFFLLVWLCVRRRLYRHRK
jgi:hypothetical protein